MTAGALGDSTLEVTGLFTSLKEDVASYKVFNLPAMTFSEMGGGVKFDLGRILKKGLPLELAGSYTITKSEAGKLSTTSNFINAGIYGRFQKRFGAFVGYQAIDLKRGGFLGVTDMMSLTESKQYQWMAGLDYSLSKNAWLSFGYGWIDVANDYSTVLATGARKFGVYGTDGSFTAMVLPGSDPLGYLLPDYYDAGVANVDGTSLKTYQSTFRQTILEASINVDF